MSKATITTPNYVRLDRTLASIGDRLVARLIDVIFIIVYETAFVGLFLPFYEGLHLRSDLVDFILRLLMVIPVLGYSLIAEYFFSGRTLGKAIMHTRVTMLDGSSPTLGALTMRWIFEPIDIWMGLLGLAVMAFSPARQRLGDLCAGTLVTKDSVKRQTLLSLDHYDYVRRDYVPVYPEAQALSLGQADVVDRVLYGNAMYTAQQVAQLARKVAQVLDVEPRETSDEAFLTAVLKDYRHFMMETV